MCLLLFSLKLMALSANGSSNENEKKERNVEAVNCRSLFHRNLSLLLTLIITEDH